MTNLHKYKLDVSDIRTTPTDQGGFPTVYFTMTLVSSELDRAGQGTIILPKGCDYLDGRDTASILVDFNHGYIFSKNSINTVGGASIVKIFVETVNNIDYLKAEASCSPDQEFKNTKGETVGSSYAMIWKYLAKKKAQVEGGDWTSHIPEDIYNEYLKDKTIQDLNGISIQKSQNKKVDIFYNEVGQQVINNWSLVAVSFISGMPVGQTQSQIDAEFDIRTIQNDNNITMTKEITNNIRCLCDYGAWLGDYYEDTIDKSIYECTGIEKSTDTEDVYTFTNILTGEAKSLTKATGETMEWVSINKILSMLIKMVADNVNLDKTTDNIRACMNCMAKTVAVTTGDIKANPEPTTTADPEPNVELEELKTQLAELKTMLEDLQKNEKDEDKLTADNVRTMIKELTTPKIVEADIRTVNLENVGRSLINDMKPQNNDFESILK